MDSWIQLKKATSLFAIILPLLSLSVLPKAQAVTPAPDGGYPNKTTAEGHDALFNLTTGIDNTALGFEALYHDTTGASNTAIGRAALFNNNGGGDNTANGAQALQNNTLGSNNTADGVLALGHNTTGNYNTAVGNEALDFNTSGVGNIALGVNAGFNVTTANHVICIGADGNNTDNSCYIGNIFGSTSLSGVAVFVNSTGRLGTTPSSARFKDEIKPMGKASEAILALRPVSFRYKKQIDPQGIAQFGLVAEEVEKVNPDLVVRDTNGKPQTVRYEQVNAMLLNEFLKEHKKVQKLEATVVQQQENFQSKVAEQQKQIEALTAGLQKVSAQLAAASPSRGGLEASKPAPQVVNNP